VCDNEEIRGVEKSAPRISLNTLTNFKETGMMYGEFNRQDR
jgi:hypothetical protein